MDVPSLVQVERELYSRSLAEFAQACWPHIGEAGDLEWGWHHDALCLHLEAVSRGEIQNLLITVPPRTLKSVIVSKIWPAWEWTYRSSTRWMFGSYAEKFAVRDAVGARDLIRSTWYRERWPEVKLKLDSDRKSDYRTTSGGFRYSFGVSGSATGEGADRIVADDPLNAMDVHSVAKRTEAIRWWTEVMPSRLNDRRTASRVVVAQRLHEHDVPAVCMDGNYVHLNLPLEYDPSRHCTTTWTTKAGEVVTWTDPRTEAGEPLDAARFPADVIEELKDVKRGGLASHAYAAQYQQDPDPIDENSIFPPERWGRWVSLPASPNGGMRIPDLRFTCWDLNFDGKKSGAAHAPGQPDMVVGWLLYLYGADLFVIDEARGQWGYADTKRRVLQFVRRCGGAVASAAAFEAAGMVAPTCTGCQETLDVCECQPIHPFAPDKHLVEKKANGHALLNELRPVLPGMIAWDPSKLGDKIQRAWAAQPAHEAEQLHLPADAPWVDDPQDGAIREFAKFPNARWDDRVDVLSQAKLAIGQSGWRAL